MNDNEQQLVPWQQDEPPLEPLAIDDEKSDANLLGPIIRRWHIVLLTFMLIAGAGVPAVWFHIKPTYTSTGAIQVTPIIQNILTGEADRGEISNYTAFMNTQARIMQSNKVLQRVADDLKDQNLAIFTDTGDLVNALKDNLANSTLTIAPDRHAEWIDITMRSQNPADAERVVNSIIRSYMAIVVSSATEGGNQKLAFVENLRDTKYEEIQRKRKLIQQLIKEYGAYSTEGREDVILQEQMALRTKLAEFEVQKLELEAQEVLLSKAAPPPAESVEVFNARNQYINNDAFVLQLTTNIAQMQQEYIAATQKMAPGNDRLQEKTRLIAALNETMEEHRAELGKKFDQLMIEEQAKVGKYKLAQVKSKIEALESLEKSYRERLTHQGESAKSTLDIQLRIQAEQEQLAFIKELYDQFQPRIQELEMEMKRPARISIADYANTGSPEDKRLKFITAVIFGALACGMFLAIVCDKMDQSVKTPDDIIRCIGVPIIGTTANSARLDRKLLTQHIANDYQTIRANLGLLSGGKMPHKLVVTSSGPGEGKTTFSVNLATSIAKAGSKVLLIDGDFRKPDIARLLHLPNGSWGVQDVFFGLRRFEETVHSMPLAGLDVLTTDGRNALDAVELLGKTHTHQCLGEISSQYDHVIIDTPPVLSVPDALLWAKMTDAVILCSFAGQTVGPALEEALQRLALIKVRVIGNVLSNVRAEHGYYPYGYGASSGNGSRESSRRKPSPFLISLPLRDDDDDAVESS